MKSPEEAAEIRKKIIEHLQHAMLLAEEAGDSTVNYMLSDAIQKIAIVMWPNNETTK